uniref:Aminopeptidase n=1 Tax=Panagrolaimus sp. PS1159 TaxID=55785 RepID=A0AC35ESX2_9BILA
MYVSEILSRPSNLSINEDVHSLKKKTLNNNGMSLSTYSHYDSGICPDVYQNRSSSSPEVVDEMEVLTEQQHSSFTLPLTHTNGKTCVNGHYTQTLLRNCNNRGPSFGMIAKDETETLFSRNRRRRQRSNSTRNIVLCLLITAVFLFALIMALFIGHWASDDYISKISQNGREESHLTSHKNLTVSDVYPPIFVEDYAPAFHRSSALRFPENPIVPLPKNVLPVHYDLNLDFTEYSTGEHIYGNVSILFESFGNSTDDEIVFHAASNIFIHKLRIRHDGQPAGIKSVKRQFKRDLVRVQLKQRLKMTWYTLEMEFRTRICQTSFEGAQCIKAKVPNSSSEIISSFTTKFEPTFARTFLPCWDEPRAKTTFNISIKHPINVTVLTNMPEQTAKNFKNDTVTTTHYQATYKMPIYLLAFVVGNFISLEMRTNRNMPLTLFLPKEDVASAHFAANFSPVIFDRIEEEFGVLYPISKMDFVAAKSFPVGGMENWGLVIFDEKAILLPSSFIEERNITVDGIFEQYKIEKIITHEIIHQWFGNLVTMYGWDELWLNEGFASYFVYDFLNDDHPHLTDNEYYIRLIELLDRQTSTSRTPLVRQLETIGDIDNMFDGLQLYTKGAVVVKMIKDLLGAFDFKAGITRYLKKNAYKSVTKDSLWKSLPTFADHGAENEKLCDVMESWLINEGMPEIIISRNYEDHTIRITQRVSDQNRYIIYLNDINFKPEEPQILHSVPKRKRSTEFDDSLIEIDKSDNIQDKLDLESEDIVKAVALGNVTTNFFEMIDSKTEESNSEEKFDSTEETLFDDSYFYAPSSTETVTITSTPAPLLSEMSVEYPSGSKKKMQKYFKKGTRKKMKSSSSKFNHEINLNNEENVLLELKKANKFPLFSNHRQQSAATLLQAERKLIVKQHSSEELFNIESDFYRKQNRRRIHSSPTTWSIPFSYWFGSADSSSGQTVRQFWVHNESIRFIDAELEANQYILANPHWIYPFKVNYDLDNWKMLIDQLNKNPREIATMSRAQLIVDSQTYLKQSGMPYLYVKLLHYLNKETDLGVLLIGLDAVHSLIDMYSATTANGPLLVYFAPVIQQFDKMLDTISNDTEMAAVWLLSPQRLTKLYQLRCIANFGSCQQNQQVEQWLSYPTALSAEHHQQITAICHHLFTQSGPKEVTLLAGLLRQKTAQWPIVLQLATCVRDETLIEEAVNRIVKSRNAAVYATVLQTSYSIQYNRKFRELFWHKLQNSLSLHERQLLFAVNTGKSDRIAQLLLHSVRGTEELEAVVQLIPEWPFNLKIHIDYLRRKYSWIEKTAVQQLQSFLIHESQN